MKINVWKGCGAMVAAVAIATMAAPAASAGPLPSGERAVPAPEGWSITLKSSGNAVAVQPSMATPQSRTAWLTTIGGVSVKAPADAVIEGKLGVGVIVGCQFPGQIGVGVEVTGPSASLGSAAGFGLGGVSPTVSLPLTPGATSSVTGFARNEPPGSIDSIKFTKSGTHTVTIKDHNVDIKHCSGYAQARVVTWVEIKGSNRIQGFLYGAPFSLG
ncbi:MspA family porin [Tsukamurella strandjordii]|uniref:MspA family porin n=1 Tax=Tsukamurella strandjordii TaxID=147577 RepID=A0AA90NSM9_9ACTN|nr:MspA family porin [Tsukamurella strandjordii]MDP0400069.1 MspA family porin [Tsukamurella strandjordii]